MEEEMKKEFRSFEDSRKSIRKLKILGNKEWRIFTKSKNFLKNIPTNPWSVYSKEKKSNT
jgi:hypothetical protein